MQYRTEKENTRIRRFASEGTCGNPTKPHFLGGLTVVGLGFSHFLGGLTVVGLGFSHFLGGLTVVGLGFSESFIGFQRRSR